MKAKIIMLENPILVSDEEIKDNQKFISFEKNLWGDKYSIHTLTKELKNKCIVDKIWNVQADMKWLRESNGYKCAKIIAGIEGLPKLDLSLIAKGIGWVDVEKLALKEYPKDLHRWAENQFDDFNESDRNTWINGFKAAQSLNEKKWTDEDMYDLMDYIARNPETKGMYKGEILKKFEASQLKEYQVELEMEEMLQKKWGNEWHDLPNQKGGREPDGIYQTVNRIKISNNTIKVLKLK